MTSTADILRGLPYFSDLSDELLSRVCGTSEQLDVSEGQTIIEEGTDSEEMYVVVEGELVVTKQSGDREVELGRISPGNVVGEIALLDEAPRTATVTAATKSKVIRVPVAAFEELLSDPRVVRRMFRTVTSRLRGIEDTLRYEERMAALGKMAAQLMHELNNPAAAVARSASELARLQAELAVETGALAGASPEVRDRARAQRQPLGPLERGEAEDAIAEWLAGLDVAGSWDLAPALVDEGWSVADLEESIGALDAQLRPHVARWLGLSAATEQVVGELAIGARRISELVRVVKEYSFLDRAPVQEIDPTEGIADTLILLKHKLKEIEVILEFSEDLHRVEAAGRDLNQVWTNLIDNACDAMEGTGKLTIAATNDGDEVVVSVADTGPGIDEETAARVFDPFFTTKEPGKGTGLGLHTVHNIVTRSGGRISVSSDSSGTTFEVRLPAIV